MAKKQSDILEWARLMVRLRARASIVSEIAGISDVDARKLWHQETGSKPPSGQQGNDEKWFLKGQRRVHSALILQLHAISSKSLPKHASLAHAYYHYARITAGISDHGSWETDPAFRRSEDDYVIPFSRAYFLVRTYTDDQYSSGKRKCDLQIRRCKSCGTLFLGHVQEVGHKCPSCSCKKPNS